MDPIDRRIDGYSFHEFKHEHRCSRDKFSLIDRQNLTFNHSVDAESSLEETRSERFKDLRVYMDRLSEIIQEYLTILKNTSFHRQIGSNRPIDAFRSPSTVQMNA